MSKVTKFVSEVANFRFILKLLVLFGLASIAPFIVLLQSVPPETRNVALIQTIAAYTALYLFFGHYIRINEPATAPAVLQSEESEAE